MVSKKDTAEEQLLKLIEGSPASTPSPPSVSPLERLRDRWRAFAAQMGRRFSLRRRPRADPFITNLRWGGRLLWVVLVGLTCVLVIDLVSPRGSYRASKDLSSSTDSLGRASSAKPEDYLKPLSVYIGSTGSRNPFGTAGGTQPVVETPVSKQAQNKLENMAQGLVIVGIDKSGNPRALIEDTNQHRTYFVKVGEELNGMMVKRISDSGVVLSYEGKEIDLTY